MRLFLASCSPPASALLRALAGSALSGALVIGLAVVGLAPAPAWARRGPAAAVGQHVAAQRGRLVERLQGTYAATNEALRVRGERLRSYRAALKRRERAAARVEELKDAGRSGLVLERALREALVLDEAAQKARAALLQQEAEVATLGARLVDLFDAVLAEKARDVRSLAAGDSRRAKAVAAYRRLAAQRDQVRQALHPVLTAEEPSVAPEALDSVRPRARDDVETLLEKADLARDLEERYRRRAKAVRERIEELQDERALAGETAAVMRESSLFDERDYRPVFQGQGSGAGPQPPRGGQGFAGFLAGAAPSAAGVDNLETEAPAARGGATDDAAPPPSPSEGETVDPVADPPADGDLNFSPGTDQDTADDDFTGDAESPTPTTGPQPSAPAATLPAEQVYLGAGAASDARLRALISSDDLDVEQLEALEKRLLREARSLRSENERIKKKLRGDLQR